MSLAMRKLVMLEKDFIAREEAARLEGYSSCPIDKEFRAKITKVLDKIRYI